MAKTGLQAPREGVRVLCVDPGFAFMGFGVVEHAGGIDRVLEMGVIKTKPAKGKVRKNEDTFRRLRESCTILWAMARRYNVAALAFEAQSLPRKSGISNAVKIGHPYGAIAMLATVLDVAAVMLTPQEVKKALCGVQNASKEEVEAAVIRLFGETAAAKRFVDKVAEKQLNHGWDALAAYIAAGNTEVMRALKRSHAHTR